MNDEKKLVVCVFNAENRGVLNTEVAGIDLFDAFEDLKERGIKVLDVAIDAYGVCMMVRTFADAKAVRNYLEAYEAESLYEATARAA